jgi:hypothetical protein
MSAEEFAEWFVMFTAEELHPSADRLRHAQMLAALHNGPLTRRGKRLWAPSEFLRDPWEQPKPKVRPSRAQIAAQVAQANAIRRRNGH